MKISLGYILGEDEASFKKLFQMYYPPLCVFAKSLVKNEAVCEDIVQEAFAQLWAKKEKIVISSSIRNYLVSTVHNLCIDHLRTTSSYRKYISSYRKANPVNNGQNPEEIYTRAELEKILSNALDSLPPVYRTVFEMSRYEGKTYDEIAGIMDISVRTAKRYVNYAEKGLETELKKNIGK